jgi:hypothetical protein
VQQSLDMSIGNDSSRCKGEVTSAGIPMSEIYIGIFKSGISLLESPVMDFSLKNHSCKNPTRIRDHTK